jgi:hypothetical protein
MIVAMVCRYNCVSHQMEFVPDEAWKVEEMLSWQEEDIEQVLDHAQTLLEQAAASLRLQYQVCGIVLQCFNDAQWDATIVRSRVHPSNHWLS